MDRCEQCGNPERDGFFIEKAGERHWFDSFECAIFAMAPPCGHCGVRVLGHGFKGDADGIYCCEHCSRAHHLAVEGNVEPV